MKDLFGSESVPETKKEYLNRRKNEERIKDGKGRWGAYRNNPMVKLHGETPGKKCKTCKFLCYKEFAKRYYKCLCRGTSGTISTDHRVNWIACALYVESQEEKI